jgi:putative hemolysin
MKTFKEFLEEMENPCWKGYKAYGVKKKGGKTVPNCVKEETLEEKSAAWQRKEGKNPEGGLNKKGIASYRKEHPGSKLSLAVTTPPSKLKKGSKAANRRKSFCARMGGMPGPMKDEKGRPTRKALSLRKWNC